MKVYETQEIDFSLQNTISAIYNKYGHSDSASSFESLYIWRKDMKLTVYIEGTLYAVKYGLKGENAWFFPVGSPDAKIRFIRSLSEKGPVEFYFMPEQESEFLSDSFPKLFNITYAPQDSEYIVGRDTFQNLKGPRFSESRRQMNKFAREHSLEVLPFSEDNMGLIYAISDSWDKNIHPSPNMLDRNATGTALDNINRLNITGIIVLMDDYPWGIYAGFKLNDTTIDCCLQKTCSNFQGSSHYLRQQFAITLPDEIKFFNLEEDLGIQGLRRAKQLLHPDSMIKMYKGTLK
jgi:hypothetical protein